MTTMVTAARGETADENAHRPKSSPAKNGRAKRVIPIAPAVFTALIPPPGAAKPLQALITVAPRAKHPKVQIDNHTVINTASPRLAAPRITTAKVRPVMTRPITKQPELRSKYLLRAAFIRHFCNSSLAPPILLWLVFLSLILFLEPKSLRVILLSPLDSRSSPAPVLFRVKTLSSSSLMVKKPLTAILTTATANNLSSELPTRMINRARAGETHLGAKNSGIIVPSSGSLPTLNQVKT